MSGGVCDLLLLSRLCDPTTLDARNRSNPSATEFLQQMAGQLDPHARSGLAAFLEMSPADAAEVARELVRHDYHPCRDRHS